MLFLQFMMCIIKHITDCYSGLYEDTVIKSTVTLYRLFCLFTLHGSQYFMSFRHFAPDALMITTLLVCNEFCIT